MKRNAQVCATPPESHFDLAEAVQAFYDSEWGTESVERFRHEAVSYRTQFRTRTQLEWITYVIRLVMTCPVLLKRPPGLAGMEWVLEDFCGILHHRGLSQTVDQDFWRAIKKVRAQLTTGRRITRGRDILRYQMIHARMNLVTTDPVKGIVPVEGMSKSGAVACQAEWEQEQSGAEISERDIYRSLKRVEKYLTKITERVSE